jgi:hypothetical protein
MTTEQHAAAVIVAMLQAAGIEARLATENPQTAQNARVTVSASMNPEPINRSGLIMREYEIEIVQNSMAQTDRQRMDPTEEMTAILQTIHAPAPPAGWDATTLDPFLDFHIGAGGEAGTETDPDGRRERVATLTVYAIPL